jgi:hypothetical protein
MAPPKVYADFQNLDDFNRLKLTSSGTLQDLARQGIELREGLVLTFCVDDTDDQGQADELQVQGTVHYHPDERCWVAAVDWAAVRHASEEENRLVNGPIPGDPTLPHESHLDRS